MISFFSGFLDCYSYQIVSQKSFYQSSDYPPLLSEADANAIISLNFEDIVYFGARGFSASHVIYMIVI